MIFSPFNFFSLFFWLDPKEPKDQGKPNRSARFAGPTPLQSASFKVLRRPVLHTISISG
jgi:hypothetical protein